MGYSIRSERTALSHAKEGKRAIGIDVVKNCYLCPEEYNHELFCCIAAVC